MAAHTECEVITATVTTIDGNTLTLDNGETLTLDDTIILTGAPEVGSALLITLCEDENGESVVVSVEVVEEAESAPATTPPPTPSPWMPPHCPRTWGMEIR